MVAWDFPVAPMQLLLLVLLGASLVASIRCTHPFHLLHLALLLVSAHPPPPTHHPPPTLRNVTLPDCGGAYEGLKPEDLKFSKLCGAPNASFVVGELHHVWCLRHESEQVALIGTELAKRRNNCTFIDVGMNDGFYTQLAGVFGCRVYSFEIQERCIDVSRAAIAANKIDHLVTIINAPVSATNGTELLHVMFPTPETAVCDGGFTFSGHDDRAKRSHHHAPLVVDRTLRTVSLDAFVPPGAYVDVVKIDVEGHETEVLEGALTLLRERRVGKLVVELGLASTYNNWTALMDVYHSIVRLNYSLTTLNCRSPRYRGANDVFTEANFAAFRNYATLKMAAPWEIWRCADLLVQSGGGA